MEPITDELGFLKGSSPRVYGKQTLSVTVTENVYIEIQRHKHKGATS